MPIYNLIEYSDNYSNTSGSLWQFKRDEVLSNNADFTIQNSPSFKYKVAHVWKMLNTVKYKEFCKKNHKSSRSMKVFQ